MSQTLSPSAAQHVADPANLTAVLTQLLRRYAAGAAAGELNDTDRAVARALDQIPDASRAAGRMVQRVLDRAGTDARLPLEHAIGADVLRAAFDQFPDEPPARATRSTHRYELRFSHLICKDETNPEFFGSDEIYVVYGWITEAEAKQGLPAHTARTPIYEDIDDGDRRPGTGSQNLRVFGPQTIGDGIAITATCMERDNGDIADVMTKISVAMTAAAAAAAALGPIAVKVLAIAKAVTEFIANALKDDPIGQTAAQSLTQANADALTASSTRVMLPVFEHKQADGHYQSFLALQRV